MLAQTQFIVYGVVSDSLTNMHLENANIYLKNTPVGALTNKEGMFILKLPEKCMGDTFVVSYLGYRTEYLKVLKDHIYNIRLVQQVQNINEVEIKENYSARRIVKLAHKRLKNNYPIKSPYCARAWYREYQMKNSKRSNVIEISTTVSDKGFYDYIKFVKVSVDSVYTFDIIDKKGMLLGVDYILTWGARVYIFHDILKKGTYILDSITRSGDDRFYHITYIPKVEKKVVYETFITDYSGNRLIPEAISTICDSTLQYFIKYHFVVNQSDYAFTYFSEYYYKYSEPNKKIKFDDIFDCREELICLNFKKEGEIYYPDVLISSYKLDYYKDDLFKEVDYKADIYSEYKIIEIINDCETNTSTRLCSADIVSFINNCLSGPKGKVIPIWFRDRIQKKYLGEEESNKQ